MMYRTLRRTTLRILPALLFLSGIALAQEQPLRVEPVDATLDRARIALIGFQNNPFWDPVAAGARAADTALDEHGASVEWIVAGATLDVPTVISAIESAVLQGYDAVGVVSLAEGACPAIRDAIGAGVPTATFIAEGACSEEARSLFFHDQDARAAGARAADAMAEAIGGAGHVGIITGFFTVEQHELRRQGFVDRIEEAYPDIEIVGTVENNDDAGRALAAANDFMTAYPDLAGIYVTAGGPFGAAQAVSQAGRSGEVAVVSYDFVPETVDLVREGTIVATIGQDPFGAAYNTAVLLFNHLAEGTAPDSYFIPVTAAVMTQDNVDAVLETQE